MTMPHLENCHHAESGWCAECVKEMGEQLIDLRQALLQVSNLRLYSTYESANLDGPPDLLEIDERDISQWKEAMKIVGDVCKKHLI